METNKCSTRACNNEKQNIFIAMLQPFKRLRANKKEVLVEKPCLEVYRGGLHYDEKDPIYIADKNTIELVIDKVYSYKGNIAVSKKDIEKIEKCFKEDSKRHTTYESFLVAHPEIEDILKNFKAGKCEIRKQIEAGKSLQPGILCECSYIQTLAKILKANRFVDLESSDFTNLPPKIAKYVESSENKMCAARYIYFNSDFSAVITQYGNPGTPDAVVFVNNKRIIAELKDVTALSFDCDLLYDEDGKFIVSERIKDECPGLENCINEFNKNASVMDYLGHNCKLTELTSKHNIQNLLRENFNKAETDLIISSSKSDELITFKPSDISFVFSDNTPLLSADNSEIRMTGKNALNSPFTPEYLKRVLKEKDVMFDEKTGLCRVYNTNEKIIGCIHGRGKAKENITRLKINHTFFVKIKDVAFGEDYFEFLINKIKQSKSGISLHIEIKKTKAEIRKELYPASVLAGFCFVFLYTSYFSLFYQSF